MRRRTLLGQVLVANLLLVSVATVAAALVAGRGDIGDDSPAGIVLAFAIALTVLAINMAGDGLRDVLDPRLQSH